MSNNTYGIFLLIIFGFMVLPMLIMLAAPLWVGPFDRFSRWKKYRNRRLCDYEDLYGTFGLIQPGSHGMLDWKYCSDVGWKSENRMSNGNGMLFLNKLSNPLAETIESRYYSPAMYNVFSRASHIVTRGQKHASYYALDEETLEFLSKIKEVWGDHCFICDGRKSIWVSADAFGVSQTQKSCRCQKKDRAPNQ